MLNWSKLAPWLAMLTAVRTALLTLGGFSSLAAAAFMFNTVAGWAVLGVLLLVLEFLARPESDSTESAGRRGIRR